MKLKLWLTQSNIKRADFAAEIGTTTTAIGRYLNGDRKPTAEVFTSIFRVTGGKVTPNDFYELTEK